MNEEMYWSFKLIDEFAFTIQHPFYMYTIHMPLKLAESVCFLKEFKYCGFQNFSIHPISSPPVEGEGGLAVWLNNFSEIIPTDEICMFNPTSNHMSEEFCH